MEAFGAERSGVAQLLLGQATIGVLRGELFPTQKLFIESTYRFCSPLFAK